MESTKILSIQAVVLIVVAHLSVDLIMMHFVCC